MPGSRELRELCQALAISPNKLLFGVDFPFQARTVVTALGELDASESAQVSATRLVLLAKLLASDERNAVLTLMHSVAVARHGDAKVKETLAAADFITGASAELARLQEQGAGDPESSAQRLDDFLTRQGHPSDPAKKLPKK